MKVELVDLRRGTAGRVAAALCLVAAVAACGTTGEPSSGAVADKVRNIAGPDGDVYTHDAILRPADGGKDSTLLVVVACPSSGECVLVGRDRTTYPDMQTFVDESEDVAPGDEVFANADPTHPDKEPKLAEYIKNDDLGWGWYAGGGALLVLVTIAGRLVIRRRRGLGSGATPPG